MYLDSCSPLTDIANRSVACIWYSNLNDPSFLVFDTGIFTPCNHCCIWYSNLLSRASSQPFFKRFDAVLNWNTRIQRIPSTSSHWHPLLVINPVSPKTFATQRHGTRFQSSTIVFSMSTFNERVFIGRNLDGTSTSLPLPGRYQADIRLWSPAYTPQGIGERPSVLVQPF